MQDAVRNWLSPPDPWESHNAARGLRHSGTAEWFIQGRAYTEWILSDSNPILWIYGKRQYLTRHLYAFDETDGSNFPQRAQAKLFFGTVKLSILILKRTDGISQFYNHPGN